MMQRARYEKHDAGYTPYRTQRSASAHPSSLHLDTHLNLPHVYNPSPLYFFPVSSFKLTIRFNTTFPSRSPSAPLSLSNAKNPVRNP